MSKTAKTYQKLATLAELYIRIRQNPIEIGDFGGILYIATLFDEGNLIYL